MRFWWINLLALFLVNCAGGTSPPPAPQPTLPAPSPTPEVALQNYGPAPELTNDVWLNVEAPLRLADLRGQVVLIDMWTFG